MFPSRDIHLSSLVSYKMSSCRTDSIRGLWGAPFERGQCPINSDRYDPIHSVVAYRHPHAIED